MKTTGSHYRLSSQTETSSSIFSHLTWKARKEGVPIAIAMNSTLSRAASASIILFSALAAMIIAPRPVILDHDDRSSGHYEIAERPQLFPIVGAFGPESFAFDPHGDGPYTGVSDGRVVKWVEEERRWIDFAFTSPNRKECDVPHDHEAMEHICGRPLGLSFNHGTGNLYIADAYHGLLVVGPDGGQATELDAAFEGGPLTFANGLDIDQLTGTVYFSDSSSEYQRRDYISLILTGDRTGRLMKYDTQTKRAKVLLESLAFANGVAITSDGSSILVSETSSCRILQYCLKTGTTRVFARLPGFPDNIKRSPRGGYWVGIFTRKGRLQEWLMDNPKVGFLLTKYVPIFPRLARWYVKLMGRGLAMRLDEEGKVLEILEGESIGNQWKSVSEVAEVGMRMGGRNKFWIGSVNMEFAGTVMR